jgi:hypothetical protein
MLRLPIYVTMLFMWASIDGVKAAVSLLAAGPIEGSGKVR